MAFRTKLDFSDNRQVKQHIETLTVLSGATNFGVPFNTLPVGPDLLTTGVTDSYTTVTSTFSGNSASTIYSWYHPAMEYAISSLSALTPSNSGTTQEVVGFSGNSYTVIDGNTIALGYSGASYDLLPLVMYDLGGGNYSGTVYTELLEIMSASTLDFTGRTIWADVSGITRTEDLIITRNPVIGNIWTCIDSEGKGAWMVNSSGGTSGTTLWSAGTGNYSLVPENHNAVASGDYSLAVGIGTIASGYLSFAVGENAIASGDYSHAIGENVQSTGYTSHAEGYGTRAYGDSSHAEGYLTRASGNTSHAEGFNTIAGGDYSHAEGIETTASGNYSHAEGFNTTSFGQYSHAEGYFTQTTGQYSHAEGYYSIASGDNSHAEGESTSATTFSSHAEGYQTLAGGPASHAEGYETTASGDYSHSQGYGSIAAGYGSHAEGYFTQAIADASHAEGDVAQASGYASHAEGSNTQADGFASHAEGTQTQAIGQNSHAEGNGSIASGDASHAEGQGSIASGVTAHAEGFNTIAGGDYSHTGGRNAYSSGLASFNHSYSSGGTSMVLSDFGAILGGENSLLTSAATRSVLLGGIGLTGSSPNTVYVPSLNIKTVGSTAFVNDIRIDANGNLTTNTSDIRFKENIIPIEGALNKIKNLNGVTYQWKDRQAGGDDIKIGFIAQEVEIVEPLLVFTNKHDGYKGIHIDGVIPLLVEAIKEITSGNNLILETQTIVAEDNNIELNYNGTIETSIGGGIRVLRGEEESSELSLDENGDWVTNNGFKPNNLVIPSYTPSSSNDEFGNIGNITQDENYLYVKTLTKWKRIKLEDF